MTKLDSVKSFVRPLSSLALFALFATLPGCGSDEGGGGSEGGSTALGGKGSGGATSGGALGSGGTTGSGGASSGGATSRGGSSSGGAGESGGTENSRGGSNAKGGASAGGATGSGGASKGGSPSMGGKSSSGGATSGGSASAGASSGGAKSSGGATGSGGSSGSCSAPPSFDGVVGWAATSSGGVTTTTGGGNATPVTVTTLAALQDAVKGTNAAVIYVKGALTAGNISVGSNKTIAGVCGGEIHGHLEFGGSVNVILQNIKVVGYGVGNCALDPDYDSSVGCSSGQDAISIQKNAHHIWIDHADISDGTDGNLDITNGANYVTVSWTKFHYTARTDDSGDDSTGASGHRFSSLVGGTDSPSSYDDANALNVTWHHNYWADRVVERQPRVRFGKNHLFNNLWASTGDNYCVRAGKQAKILLENNVFQGVKNPQQFNSTADEDTAYITATGNVYTDTSGTQATKGGGTPFTNPGYQYSLDPADSVATAVKNGAGPK